MSCLSLITPVEAAIVAVSPPGVTVLPVVAVFLVAASIALLRRSFTGIPAERGLLTFVGCWLLVMGLIFFGWWRSPDMALGGTRDERTLLLAIKATALIVFALPFVLRLHSKWLGGKATAEELEGGAAGVRAWLSLLNCGVAIMVAVMLWVTFDISLMAMLLLTFALLLAFPAVHGLPENEAEVGPLPDPGGMEREKVLAMLEAGRITAEESAELLNALAASRPLAVSRTEPLTPATRLVMIGACLVLVGFFFPWFSISPGQEMARAMDGMRASLPMEIPGLNLGQGSSELQIRIIGSEIQHGWGWMVLACAMTTAILPFFTKSLDRATRDLLRLLALGVGSVVLLSVVGSGIRWISFGLVAVLAGYAVAWLGLLRGRVPNRVLAARVIE